MSSTVPQQGIVSILGSDHDRAASLRRTLSADMSSKKWLTQNGFSNPPMKRIASSEELNEKYDSNSSHKEVEAPSQEDIWSLIISKKAKEEENSTLPPPYIHPLVRRSTSSLSEKSLEICTESLGSETGSDKLSSYPPSETGDAELEDEIVVHLHPQLVVAKFNISSSKKSTSSPPKSFPPPLPSLAPKDGPSLHMQPRRKDGRLVLEAVAVPSQNCFSAHRENGRLRLTFAKTSLTQELENIEDDVNDVDGKVLSYFEEEKEEETEEEEDENEEEVVEKFELENDDKEHGIVINQGQDYSGRVIYVHRSALVMKNLMGLSNRDPKWSEKLKKKVDLVKMELQMEEDYTTLSQSLPRPTRMAKVTTSPHIAASFNAYEYYWTSKPIEQEKSPLNNCSQNVICQKINLSKEMELFKGNKGDQLVPLVRGCNENKKSLLFWKPYCIATS